MSAELTEFQSRLGHDFARPDLLQQALTHSSLSSPTRSDNQRLEFLGDRVLGLVIAEALLERDPDASEGTLAPQFNALVRKETCAEVALAIDLGAALRLGRSEMLSGGRRKTAVLGDAMEAVLAAVYTDAGFDVSRKLILRLWAPHMETVEDSARDPKTALQEWAQARGMKPPKYVELSRSGPDHAPVFEIEARLADGRNSVAKASAKRAAQQDAARALLAEVETSDG